MSSRKGYHGLNWTGLDWTEGSFCLGLMMLWTFVNTLSFVFMFVSSFIVSS